MDSGRKSSLRESTSPSIEQAQREDLENIYKNPMGISNSHSPLKINVNMINNSQNEVGNKAVALGEPFNLSPSPSISTSKINFDKITQLPTPVINNNQETFGNFSPPKEHYIEIPKTRQVKKHDTARVVSEYKPVPAGHLGLDMHTSNKRFVSNPLNDDSSLGSSVLVSNMPSPPDEIQSRFADQVFYAINQGKQYTFEDEIGSGNFSTVVLGSNVEDANDKVAIKIISVPNDNIDEIHNFKFFIKRELNILHNISHPCIVHLLDYNLSLNIPRSDIETSIAIESEHASEEDVTLKRDSNNLKLNNEQLVFLNYCPGGNLFQFLLNNYKSYHTDFVYWSIIQRIVSEVILSVSYLHSNDIIHRDIKLENVLLNYKLQDLLNFTHSGELFSKPIINLTDFGLSKKLKSPDELFTTRCGSEDYIPPELLMGLKYDGRLTDSWSVGVLIYALLENRLPFDIPPLSTSSPSGISPSVIKRKRARNNVPHRIAMIDWDWFKLTDMLNNPQISQPTKTILHTLKHTVDLLLVRKDRRVKIENLLTRPDFDWIFQSLPKGLNFKLE